MGEDLDFRGIPLDAACLAGAVLPVGNFAGVRMAGADLYGGHFGGCPFAGADLTRPHPAAGHNS